MSSMRIVTATVAVVSPRGVVVTSWVYNKRRGTAFRKIALNGIFFWVIMQNVGGTDGEKQNQTLHSETSMITIIGLMVFIII